MRELLKLIGNIRQEIKDLAEHGDIPWDSRDDIYSWLDKAEAIAEKEANNIEAYEQFEGDVEYAMDKVGWNNSRIEEAYDELQKSLKGD
jgi:hypothetical protein